VKRHMYATLAITALSGLFYLPLDAVMYVWNKMKGAASK